MGTRPLRTLSLLVVILAVLAGGWWFWQNRSEKDDEPKYRTETVDRGTVQETVSATGAISAVITVQVGSQVSGIVSRLLVDFNSPVRKGQLLAELDPTPFRASLDQRRADLSRAEVQMRQAEIEFRRSERLLALGLTPEADYDAAKAGFEAAGAQVEQARAAARQAEANLSYTKIYSPIDGVVVDRQYDVGQTVAASFQAPTLFTIAQDLTKMQVQADVDQADIGRVSAGQNARFTKAAQFAADFKAKFGADPQPFAAQGFDSAAVCLAAIKNAADAAGGEVPTREAVRDAIRALPIEGLTGTISFDSIGDLPTAKYFIIKVNATSGDTWNPTRSLLNSTLPLLAWVSSI